MNGWLILALIILSASIPALAVFFWFRVSRYPFSSIRFLLILLTGAAAFFPALVLQSFFPPDFYIPGRLGLIVQIFLPVALTEEFSRLLVLLVFFYITRKIDAGRRSSETIHSGVSASVSALAGYGTVIYGSAAGLVAGFGFAILESAAYSAANPGVTLLRLFTAAPIHGACGARVGAAALLFRTHPTQGLFRFLTAVMIHGIYNFMIVIPGFISIAAVLIALFSLASAILSIHGGMKPRQA
jgi:RsiW-degrading membrane proteinase PrsW (M82 family)